MTELIGPGLELSLVGMTIVFIFLTMLIFSVNMMSAIILRFFPEAPVEVEKTATDGTDDKDEVDSDVLAAICAAVHTHKARNKQLS
jgi:oxaloacetate decarboxylase gamma subunit